MEAIALALGCSKPKKRAFFKHYVTYLHLLFSRLFSYVTFSLEMLMIIMVRILYASRTNNSLFYYISVLYISNVLYFSNSLFKKNVWYHGLLQCGIRKLIIYGPEYQWWKIEMPLDYLREFLCIGHIVVFCIGNILDYFMYFIDFKFFLGDLSR